MILTPESGKAGGGDGARHPRRMPIAQVAAALRADAESVALALLAPAHGEPTQRGKRELRWGRKGSLRVHIAGPRKGSWIDEGDGGAGGDMLALAVREHGGKDGGYEWARRRCGDTGDDAPLPAHVPPAASAADVKRAAEAEAAREAKRTADARAIWEKGVNPAGTQTEAYLRARGCWPLPPGCVAVRHTDNVHDSDGKPFPAMLVAATKPDGTFCGIQRTYLDRGGEPCKATGAASPKESKGALDDAAVWLTPGAHGRVVLGERATGCTRGGRFNLSVPAWRTSMVSRTSLLGSPFPRPSPHPPTLL